MADTPIVQLCILWEDELRQAAELLKAANDLPEDDPGALKASQQAWAACSVALHGLTAEKSVVMLAHRDVRIPKSRAASTNTNPRAD